MLKRNKLTVLQGQASEGVSLADGRNGEKPASRRTSLFARHLAQPDIHHQFMRQHIQFLLQRVERESDGHQ